MDSSGFGTFHDNVVTANRSYALHVDVGLAGLLDAGNTLTGNDSAGVELYGVVTVSTTWPNLGVPYIIGKVTVGDSINNPVLTIAPGVEIRFRQQGWLNAGMYLWHIPGRIIADGSAGRIRFTSSAASPAPGDFSGVGIYPGPSDESEFRNCDFAYGGGTGGDKALLLVYGRSPAITGCDFGPSAGWGITYQTAQATDTVGLRATNTFHDCVGGDINWIYTPASPGD
jgi:hypothetical protein